MNMEAVCLHICVCILMMMLPVKCQDCPTNCKSCTFEGTLKMCSSCIDGYYLSGSSCLSCSYYCATCSDASSCRTCKPGVYVPATCHLNCSSNCLDDLCDENTGYCIECPSERYGYRCDFDCGICKNEQCDLRQCTDGCKRGYWQYKDIDYTECRPCVDNCVSCVNGSICNACKDGAYLDTHSETRKYCVPCPLSCEKCSIFTACSACISGYIGNACEHECSSIIAGCQLCDSDGASTVACNQCDNGWTLQDNTCVEIPHQCTTNCGRCLGDNVCEICKTGWVGALCAESCQTIQHCIACHEADGFIMCNVCDEGYALMNGECSATTTRTKSSTPSTTSSRQITISEPTVSEYSTPVPQSQNTRFQTSAFLIGFVAGIGICICAILLTVLVWFLRRRQRLQKSTVSHHNEPFYENSFAANESNTTTMNPDGPNQENIQQMQQVGENDSEPADDKHNTPVGGESVSTSTIIDQHDYTRLNVRHGEHIYKDLTAL